VILSHSNAHQLWRGTKIADATQRSAYLSTLPADIDPKRCEVVIRHAPALSRAAKFYARGVYDCSRGNTTIHYDQFGAEVSLLDEVLPMQTALPSPIVPSNPPPVDPGAPSSDAGAP
jgi:hypothetical protein